MKSSSEQHSVYVVGGLLAVNLGCAPSLGAGF